MESDGVVGQLFVVAALGLGSSGCCIGRQIIGAAQLVIVTFDRGADICDVVANRR